MSKKALILIMTAVLALSAVAVMAQDGPGVIDITLPDGSRVPVFTDGRLNAFDMAAPVVVYYTAANGTVVNPNFTTDQVDEVNLNGASTNTNTIGNANTNSTTSASAATPQPDPNGLINKLQVLAIDPTTSNGNLVIEASVDELFNLVTGRQNSLADQGYSVNFDPKSNNFWVQSPANFEGKVYTFAWHNNLFPTRLIGERFQTGVQSSQAQSSQAQATAEPTQAQPTMQPTPST